jgi:hypothetical protein
LPTLALTISLSPSHQPEITSNVNFDTLAREIRCKWSDSDEKASLSACQEILETHLPALKESGGTVKRVVCGGCKDFKIITAMPADKFGPFADGGHGPEEAIMTALKGVKGVSGIENQTYTFMEL